MKPGLLMLPSAVSDSRVHNILPNKIETDFQFSRASAATRVNHQGLIENVGYFSDELVRNGNFSELGSELVTNGDFATDSDWNKQTGWSINNGKAVAENAGNPTAAIIGQSGYSLIIGKTYKVVYTISDYVKGIVRPQFIGGGTSNLPNASANGTYTEYFVAVNNSTTFRFRAATTDGGFTGKIDNVSVKQVDPDNDWVINGEWEYVDNGVSITNATGTYNDSALFQLITLDSSKQYKATIDVSSISGSLQVYTGLFSAGFTVNTTGIKSFILDLTSLGGRFNLLPGNGSDVVIKSFSLVEVIGDKPRLDYDPTNPTCPHLLLEPQSTNLSTFSEDFSQSAWGKGDAQILSATHKNPDGTTNAKVLAYNGGTNQHYMQFTPSVSSGQNYTFSIFLKAKELKYVCLIFLNDFGGRYFDLENGTLLGTAGAGVDDSKIEDFGNGWYRCSITDSATSTTKFSGVYLSEDGTSIGPVTPTNTNGIYVWGAMFEQQLYATSYIPTAGSTETRVGEICTNAGNVDTFNSQEGVLYAEIAALADDGTFRMLSINDNTNNNRVRINYSATSQQIQVRLVTGGVTQADLAKYASDVTTFNKVAVKYEANDVKLFVNGDLIASDTSASVPAANTFYLLKFYGGLNSNIFYGKTKALATYNRALTDTELYTITSTQYSAYSGMVAALGNYTIPC